MLYYISNADIPGKKAHTIQQVRMCQAFRRAGEKVCLVHPSHGSIRNKLQWDDISDFYALETQFQIETVPTLQSRFRTVPQVGLLSMAGSITAWLARRLLMNTIDESDVIYARNYYGLFLFNEVRKLFPSSRQPTLVFESHIPISAHFKPRFFQSVDKIVSITQKLKKYLVDTYALPGSKILVAPDGVDMTQYDQLSKLEARRELELPQEQNIIMYTGHLYEGKGVETLIEAAPGLDGLVYIVGGYEEDKERLISEVGHPDNVVFTGFIDPGKIPQYQIAADILVAPYTESSRPWISPLKIFEYMAAGRPIVASDRDVLQEVLIHGENAYLFSMGDATALRGSIKSVLDSNELQADLVNNAMKTVSDYTWESRAKSILDWINQDELE